MTRQTNFTQASVIGNASHEVEPSPFKTPDSIPRTLSDPKSETGDAKGKAQANAINLASEHKPGDASFGRAYARNASPDGETAAKKEEHSNNSGCVSPTDTNAVKTDGANNNGSTTNAGKKRKPGSSRGVANLTPHQLARKRANDREAQRAIRKRTKEQIESLERRVEELTSQRPYQDLQAALRERDNVLAENEEIRKRLASVLGIIQPILNASGLTEQQLANASQSLILTPNTNPSITPAAHNLPPPPFMPPITSSSHAQPLIAQDAATAAATGAAAGHIAPDPTSSTLPAMLGTPFQAPSLNSSGRGFATPSPPTSTTGPGNGAAMFATPSNWHSNELSPNQEQQNQQHQQQQQPAWSTCNFMDMKRRSLSQTLEFSADGERLGFNFLLDSSHRPGSGSGLGGFGAFSSSGSSGRTGTTPPEFSSRLDGEASSGLGTGLMSMRSGDLVSGFGTPQVPTTTVVPAATTTGATAAGTTRSSPSPSATGNLTIKNIPPTCPMDGILLDFLSSRRRKAAEGASSGQLVGPPYPSVSSLLNPENNTYSHPISQVFTEILRTFPHLVALPDRVAVLYLMFLLMRWQIYPTKENYDRLPEWLIPLPCQYSTPHPAWMDYVVFPRMRERLVSDHTRYPFASWFIPYTATLSVNWPYEPTDALLATADCDELLINPVFEQHLRDLKNWSLGPAFVQALPQLKDTARIKE